MRSSPVALSRGAVESLTHRPPTRPPHCVLFSSTSPAPVSVQRLTESVVQAASSDRSTKVGC